MEKLNNLISRCKCSVDLTINNHRDNCCTVEKYFKDIKDTYNQELLDDIESDIYNKMIETDTIIELSFYPDTPIGYYKIYHYDLETAINLALVIINKQ